MSGRKSKVGGNGGNLAHFIKIGGSTFDAAHYGSDSEILPKLAREIVAYKASKSASEQPIIVVTCGGGPNADFFKETLESIGYSQRTFEKATEDSVKNNCRIFTDLLQQAAESLDDKVEVAFSENTADLATNGTMVSQVSVVPFASEELQFQILNRIYPFNKSDVHSLICAEGLGLYLLKHRYARGIRIHFVKDADGVYSFDPKREDKKEEPTKYDKITVEDFLVRVDRRSYDFRQDGQKKLTDDHILETDAAEILRDQLKIVKGIRIINHTPETRLTSSMQYGKGGTLVYNKYMTGHPRHRSDTTYVKPSN